VTHDQTVLYCNVTILKR